VRISRPAQPDQRRFPRLGPGLYISSVQYFLVQVIVAYDWPRPYSIGRNTISDLGNTRCGTYNDRFVCSPLHGVMNASFIVLGLAMTLGSLLLIRRFPGSRGALIGLAAMALSGIGVLMVGVFPENAVPRLHGTGAGITFLVGNASVIALGYFLRLPAPLRIYSLLSGAVALLALGCFAKGYYLGLGEGGAERIVAYPQTAWLIVVGLYLLRGGATPGTPRAAARRPGRARRSPGRAGDASRAGRPSRRALRRR
jgi:hypothetical membrane protein